MITGCKRVTKKGKRQAKQNITKIPNYN